MATKKKSAGGGFGKWLILTPMILLAGTFLLPITIIVVVGLVPSMLSFSVDREKGKLSTITIAALNFAALIPVIMRLWDDGLTLENAIQLITNPFIWVLVMAGALVGWMLAQVVPTMVVSIFAARDRRLLEKIRTRQKALVEEWGAAVAEPQDRQKG